MSVDARIIVPNSRNMNTFFERSLAVKESLKKMNIDSSIDVYDIKEIFGGHIMLDCKPYDYRRGLIKEADLNIYMDGYNFIPDPKKINICMQTEHLPKKRFDHFVYSIKDWDLVLDLFRDNITENINHVYFPMGYSKYFDIDIVDNERENMCVYDSLFFFGEMSPHRDKISKEYGVKTKIVFGKDRDKMIMQHKAGININRCPLLKFYFPAFRALLYFCKGRSFFQEDCAGDYGLFGNLAIKYDQSNIDILNGFSKNELLEMGAKNRRYLMENHKFEDHFYECARDTIK